MSHANKESLTKQISDILGEMYTPGRNKHQDKALGLTDKYIYSKSTLKTYLRFDNYFCKYCKTEYRSKTLEECKKHIDDYLQNKIDKKESVSSIKTYASAIAKLYHCSTEEFIDTGVRHRADITRSRNKVNRDANFKEENNKGFVDFCRSTGLRRREVTMLKNPKFYCIKGKYYIDIKDGTKGGRPRTVEVIGNIQNVKTILERAKEGKVFEKVPNAADIHSFRSDYACSLYRKYSRKEIPISDQYKCRIDLKGVIYDKRAMSIVSQNLGHNRISVIAQSYLRNI